jgi:electron transport complex protein RnfC
MMGISTPDPTAPVLKNTNAITAMSLPEASQPKATQCIHCGKCATHCPMNLTTFAIARAFERDDVEELARLRVDLCVECGCCSFICPAKRPLVEINKLSKAKVRAYQAKQKQLAAEKEAAKAAEAAKEAPKA